jgi:CRP-like cAMP-binding protein
MDKLRRQLARAKHHSAKGRETIARQRALILRLEKHGHDTSVAEEVLRTMLHTQDLQEDTERGLIEELKSVAPEEWRLHHAKKSEAPASNRGNKLLGSLSFGDLALMQPFLERVVLKFRYRLQMANRAMKMVYFPESGMISVVAVTGGGRNQTQVGLIGREGMTGMSIGFGSRRCPFDLQVEVDGQGQCIATEKLMNLMDQSPSIRTTLVDYLHTLWLQFAHTAAANAQGTVEQRLARLLLLASDRLDSDEIRLTHEQLAMMLSVRRAGVTIGLQDLETCDLIDRERGIITIVDRAGLEAKAQHLN